MSEALSTRERELISIGDGLFSARRGLDTLWQEIAEHYYFERADFTTQRGIGDDYAAGVMTSYPHLARRELGGLMPAMLRSGDWFETHAKDERVDKRHDARTWLEWATKVQYRAMYDRDAGFIRATSEADQDFVTFGNAVISVELNLANTSLLYRNWHLRDCAWTENEIGRVDTMHRKWKPTARVLKQRFKKTIHADVEKLCKEKPEQTVDCRHIVVPRDDYDYRDDRARRADFMSIYIDVEHQTILEQQPIGWFSYVPPRWATISGSQYAYSPAVILPDARSAQIVRRVLLEAGEKAVDPPMIATQDAIRSDLGLYAGGVTWVDIEYDERLGEALRPISQDTRGLPFGVEIEERIQEAIANSFFLNKVILPPDMGKMTAYEVRKRVEEHVRSSTPLFEPVDQSYSAPLCETTFEALKWVGAFGRVEDMPESLRGADIEYDFQNPIRKAAEEMQPQIFMEGLAMTKAAAELDPAQISQVNPTKAFRGAMKGMGWPEEWLEDEERVAETRAANAERQKVQEGAQALGAAAQIAEQGGKAAQALQGAGVV